MIKMPLTQFTNCFLIVYNLLNFNLSYIRTNMHSLDNVWIEYNAKGGDQCVIAEKIGA